MMIVQIVWVNRGGRRRHLRHPARRRHLMMAVIVQHTFPRFYVAPEMAGRRAGVAVVGSESAP